MAGRKKAYEWKSQHIEAQLVKMGLEEPDRDRDSKSRKRKQVAARHQARASTAGIGGLRGPPLAPHQQHARLPGMYEPAAYHYGQHAMPHGQGPPAAAHHQSYDPRFEAAGLAEELGVSQPPPLTDEQQERMIDEVLDRSAFETDDDEQPSEAAASASADVRMSEDSPYDAVRSRPRAGSLLPGINGLPAEHNGASPDVNAQRSAAVARGACVELMSRQQYGPGVGA